MFITSGGYRAKALTRRICITIKSFFVPRSQQDRKHLSLFLYQAKESTNLLFYLQIKSFFSWLSPPLFSKTLTFDFRTILGSISVSRQLPTCPSPNPTLTLTCYQLTAEGLGER